MATKVTDPALLEQLNGGQPARKVTDPALLDQLNGKTPQAPQAAPTMPFMPLAGSPGFRVNAVESVPIAGPYLRGGMENAEAWLRSVFGGQSFDAEKKKVHDSNELWKQLDPANAAFGTAFGTTAPFIVGGAIPGVSRALGMTGGPVSQVGFGAGSGMLINGADTLARGGTPGDAIKSAAIGGALGGGVPAVLHGAGAVINAITGKSVTPEVRNITRALKDDQIPAAQLPRRLADLGEGAMVMDLGPNLQRQAGALASVPGPAQKVIRDAVKARQAGTSQRVADDVAQTVGTGPDIDALKEQIVTAQKAAADPLYTAVRDLPLKGTGNLTLVAQTPMGKAAFVKAIEMMANDGKRPGGLTVGLIDYAKRALDDIATSAARAGNNNVARQARDMTRLLLKEADAQVPGYAKARDAFAGPAQVLDAMDAGQAVFSKDMSPAQLQSAMNKMSSSELAAFMESARASIEASMGTAVNDALALRNLFKSGWNEQKLRLMLGNTIADDLMQRISREVTFGDTRNVVTGNSETAARQAAQREVAPQLSDVHPEGLVGIGSRALTWVKQAFQTARQKTANTRHASTLAAGQVSPQMMKQLATAARPGLSQIPGGALPMIPNTNRKKPLQITVIGGN